MGATKYWLWLSGESRVSPKAKAALISHYQDAERAFFAPSGEYASVPGISLFEAERLEKRELRNAEHIMAECAKQGIDIITMEDARYPLRLKSIYSPPPVLYVKGHLPDVDSVPAFAVIGTRRASAYGLKMGRRLAFEIAGSGGIVISMLSEGVDKEAALGCLSAEGCCVGVLGAAHERENSLQRDIISHGALVSEYPPGTPYNKHHFRERNRIAAGLSCAVLVVEAPEKSGALLFAAEALEQGREVFAVPGNADAANSVGTNELIKQGAKPVTCGWDMLSEFEQLFPGRLHRSGAVAFEPEKPEEKEPEPRHEQRQNTTIKDVDKKKHQGYIDLRAQLKDLSEEQLMIISAVEKNNTHIDDIIESTGLSTAKVLSQLTVLEIKGFVQRSAGRRISLNIKSK